MKPGSAKTVGCAIYTRVSTEQGLEQDVLYDALVIVSPQLLPSFQKTDGSAPMPAEMQMKMPKAATHQP
jgi:hypothetical protein